MAEVVKASVMWAGPKNDVLKVVVEPSPDDWLTEPVDGDIALFRLPDIDDEPTGPLVGIEIIDFLSFDRWEDLLKLSMLWHTEGLEPLPLERLLKRLQVKLKRKAGAGRAA